MVSFLTDIRSNLESTHSTESVEIQNAKDKIKSSIDRRTAMSPKRSMSPTPFDDILKLNA